MWFISSYKQPQRHVKYLQQHLPPLYTSAVCTFRHSLSRTCALPEFIQVCHSTPGVKRAQLRRLPSFTATFVQYNINKWSFCTVCEPNYKNIHNFNLTIIRLFVMWLYIKEFTATFLSCVKWMLGETQQHQQFGGQSAIATLKTQYSTFECKLKL